jgi:hypothetical protein
VVEAKKTTDLFSPDVDELDRYGRDFVHSEVGLGRITIVANRFPYALVKFLDIENDAFTKPYFRGKLVELTDAVTDDAQAEQMIQATLLAEEVLD